MVTNFYSDSAALLLSNGMVISMGLSGALLYASNWIGLKFDSYMESGYVVGNEEEESNLGKKEKKRKKEKRKVTVKTAIEIEREREKETSELIVCLKMKFEK